MLPWREHLEKMSRVEGESLRAWVLTVARIIQEKKRDARCKGVSEKTSLAFSFEFLALPPHAGPSAVLPHLQRSLLSTRTAVPESSSLAYLFRVETGVGFLIWVSQGET